MKIYLDTCCYGRPYDDRTQTKIDTEALAVMGAIDMCRTAGHYIVGSMAVTTELKDIQDANLRANIEGFYYRTINGNIPLIEADFARAVSLQTGGLGDMDSLHLAAAEAAGVDMLLTTDDKFEKAATNKKLSNVKVINPSNFLLELIK